MKAEDFINEGDNKEIKPWRRSSEKINPDEQRRLVRQTLLELMKDFDEQQRHPHDDRPIKSNVYYPTFGYAA